MAYTKIEWENEPSVDTPIDEDNLNHMDEGIAAIDQDLASFKINGSMQALTVGAHLEQPMQGSTLLVGKYNNPDNSAIMQVANGTSANDKLNLLTVRKNNTIELNCDTAITGDLAVGGDVTDGAGNKLSDKIDTADVLAMLPVDSASGNPCVITDAFGDLAKSLKLTMNPIQSGSGTPSPQNVRPISGRTQSNITRIGKNLYWGSPSFNSYANISNWEKQSETYNGHDVYKNVGAWNGLNRTIFLKAGTYTFSCMVKGSQAGTPLYIFNASNTILLSTTVGTSWQKVSAVLNLGTDSNVTLRVETNGATPSLYVAEYQLEVGSTATPYEPYNGESITRTYGQTVYGGVLDVTSGLLTIDRVLITLDGSETPQGVSNNYPGSLIYNTSSTTFSGIDFSKIVVCDKLKSVTSLSDFVLYSCLSAWSTSFNFWVRDTAFADVNEAKTWLSNNNLTVVCYLTTPTTVQLTAEEVTLLHGDNVITTDADSIEASYSADIALYIAKKIAEGISQGNRSLSKGGSEEDSEEEPIEELKEEEDMR